MTDRHDAGGGGLTGATGDLTPDESDGPFVPAERREQADDTRQPIDDDESPRRPGRAPSHGVNDITDEEERF